MPDSPAVERIPPAAGAECLDSHRLVETRHPSDESILVELPNAQLVYEFVFRM
jgi:hypothetical protein